MPIKAVQLKHFRCFSTLTLDLNYPIIFIMGANGIGKTSILEALHYACYLKSFKTHIPKELIQMDQDSFSIQVTLDNDNQVNLLDTIAIGFSHNKRLVKINQKNVRSHKELIQLYKVITLTEDDLLLVKGAPSLRRTFLDQLLVLLDPTFSESLRTYKTILENRNALLAHVADDTEQYHLWTDQLLNLSSSIQKKRISLLEKLESAVNTLGSSVFGESELFSLTYTYGIPYRISPHLTTTSELRAKFPLLQAQERRYKRSLIGSHLDDFQITFQHKNARFFASRGQQKCLVFLLKLAQLYALQTEQPDNGATFLIDDFMVDLDKEKIASLIPLISQLTKQVIITSPIDQTILKDILFLHEPRSKIITL